MSIGYEVLGNEIRHILNYETCAYPLYVHFFRFLINKGLYRQREHRKLSYRTMLSYFKTSKYLIRKLPSYLQKVFSSKPTEEVDILFLSRYRPTEINATKNVKTDYLFNTIIDKIDKSPLRPDMALMAQTDEKHYTDDRVHNVNVLDFLSLRILLKSTFHSFLLYFKYKKISKRLLMGKDRM